MRVRMLVGFVLLGAGLLAGGCIGPSTDPRIGEFQGGSSPIQALSKVLSNNLGALNPDDIQMIMALAEEFSGQDLPDVSDALADAVIKVMQANGVTTFESLERLLIAAVEDPSVVVLPDGVEAVVMAEVQAVFEQIVDPAIRGSLQQAGRVYEI